MAPNSCSRKKQSTPADNKLRINFLWGSPLLQLEESSRGEHSSAEALNRLNTNVGLYTWKYTQKAAEGF